jgi:hypothetical protein
MIRFKNFIKEELNDKEKAEVAKWPRDPKALEATDHYFGKGNDEKHEELSGTVDKSEVHKAIERHLGKEIEPNDYKAGVTDDKYGRKTKIGGMLTKSKADPKLINNFANDSTRQGKTQKGLTVKVTRSPAGVAGQTSHGQDWENQSCKNFNTGSNRHYLEGEVKHGTVVAYLHNHKGEEIARSTLQPHINDEGHTAYAVDSHYGLDHAGFKQHAEDLAKRLSGEPKKGDSIVYKKHYKVYDDNGQSTILHPNASKEHIDHALDDEREDVRMAAISHPNATKAHINHALNDDDYEVRQAAVSNKNATSEHIDKALNDKSGMVRMAAAAHPNASSKHIDKALNDKSEHVRHVAVRNKNATSEQIDKALNDDSPYVRQGAVNNPNASKEHLDKAITDGEYRIRYMAANHKNATPEHKAKSAQYEEDVKKRIAIASHPNASEKDLDNALKDKDVEVRKAAANHPNATLEQYKTAVNDKNSQVAHAAARNKNFHKLVYNMTLPVKESIHHVKRIKIIKECVKKYV